MVATNCAELKTMQKFSFDIDVTGSCNLRCPSCPQGNIKDYRLPIGFMEPELLSRIVRKAASECPVTGISLFNWTEPLLHPRLPELIRIVQNADIPCHLSSNLNVLPDADAIMAENPASFKISVSGFTQGVYGLSHRGGDIERVKRHMVELAEAKKRNHSTTRIFVNYHRYRHNLKEEPMMRQFAADLDFSFEPVWALFLPLEKILACCGEEAPVFPLTDEDLQLIAHLALPPGPALEYSQYRRTRACRLRDAQVSMDFQGNVLLCCGIFDASLYTLGSYLDIPLDEIQRIRTGHDMCRRCMQAGGHMYLTYDTPHLDRLVLESISSEDARQLAIRREFALKRLDRYLQHIYQNYLAKIITGRPKAALKAAFGLLHALERSGR